MKRFWNIVLIVGIALLLAGGGTYITVRYLNSQKRDVPVVFSDNAMLHELWTASKKNNIEPTSGRTLDRTQKDITTSEGQSYTMLRAAWMDDQSTFDSSWNFTKNNLQRSDKLFSWRYGKLPNGSYGILTSEGGQNTASDGDSDIALSLLMAYKRWNQTKYLDEAKPIINAMWEKEVISVGGKPVFVADDLERNSQTNIVVNPSYFSPYAYKVFAKIDKQHDWTGLANNSYALLNRLGSDKLNSSGAVGLPPDWIRMNRQTGAFVAPLSPQTTNYSYDAMRTPWRLALDYQWFGDSRAKDALSRYSFLSDFWNNYKVINTTYAHNGKVVDAYESPAMYGTAMGYFSVIDPTTAKAIYNTKLSTLYSPDQQSWKAPAPNYYDDNWAWFGIALAQHALPNLTK